MRGGVLRFVMRQMRVHYGFSNVLCFPKWTADQFYRVFGAPFFVEYFFIMRFNASIISGFESLLVESFVTIRFNTSSFSVLENWLVENFVIRRFNMSSFSGLDRLFFADITYWPFQCILSPKPRGGRIHCIINILFWKHNAFHHSFYMFLHHNWHAIDCNPPIVMA